MSTFIIPIDNAVNDARFVQTIDLDGEDFQLDIYYNSRDERWYFNLLDKEGNQLRSGLKIVANYPLLKLMMQTPRPLGELICLNIKIDPLDPVLDDLGVTMFMAYEQQVSLP